MTDPFPSGRFSSEGPQRPTEERRGLSRYLGRSLSRLADSTSRASITSPDDQGDSSGQLPRRRPLDETDDKVWAQKEKYMRDGGGTQERLFTDPDPNRSSLCYTCRAFMDNLHHHPWSDKTRASYPVGYSHFSLDQANHFAQWHTSHTKHVGASGSCALGNMIWDILKSNLPSDVTMQEVKYLLRPTKFGEVYEKVPKLAIGEPASEEKVPCSRWCLSIEIDTPGVPARKVRPLILNVVHGATRPLPGTLYDPREEKPPFLQRGFFYGRPRPPQCNFALLRSWIDLCAKHHGLACKSSHPGRKVALRLVDTKNLCIKIYPPGKTIPDYAALSYVCGDLQQTYVKKHKSYSILEKRGVLTSVRLSNSISDAVTLVQKLGVRYLWTDALCIDQRNTLDLEEQIANMGFVYQGALFTIVAAYGENCDAGLPGVEPGTRLRRHNIAEMGNITLLSSVQTPSDKTLPPTTSTWAQRGWTFQEDVLSQRQLVFTGEQVWWRCRCATWCEQLKLESQDQVGFLLADYVPRVFSRDQYTDMTLSKYSPLVADYARRQLTFAFDALNAFLGILSTLTDYSGEKFLWGHMLSHFERQLYWVGHSSPRAPPQYGYFPTWSWVGWHGEVSLRHVETYDPVVTCVVASSEGETRRYSRLSSVSGIPAGSRSLLGSADIVAGAINDQLAMVPKSGFHLLFYTFIATFYLMPQGRLVLPDLPPRDEFDSRGSWCGFKPDYGLLVPSLHGPDLCEKGFRECILLGRRAPASKWDRPHVVVMLIKRSFGIAYRLGIADMPEEFWEAAQRSWKLIVLG